MAIYLGFLVGCALYTTVTAEDLLRGTLLGSGNTEREALGHVPKVYFEAEGLDEVSVIFLIVLIF